MSKNPFNPLVESYLNKELGKYEYIDKMHYFNKLLYYFSKRLKDTDILKIEISDETLVFTTREHGLKMTFNGRDRRGVPYDILNFGKYDEEDELIIYDLISNGDTIFDVGANIGWYSVNFYKRYPNSKIYSFEPIFDTYKYLVTNAMLNGGFDIKLFNLGLSEKEGEAEFYYFPAGSVLASMANVIKSDKAQKVKCQLKTLDNVVKEHNISTIDFIKCDVEGAEMSVLKGGINSIQQFLPIIFIELYAPWTEQFGYHPDDVLSELRTLGYFCYFPIKGKLHKTSKIIHNPDEERLNFLFLHEEKHKKYINDMII